MNLITKDQLKMKLDQGEDVIILDVRDEDKYQAGSLVYKGVEVTNIPYVRMVADEVDAERLLNELPTGVDIITICTTGNKAQKAAAFLREKGYSAGSLEGGLTSWNEK